jgi:hypothetical protein
LEAHLGLTALLWGIVLIFPPDVIPAYAHLRSFRLTTDSDLIWGWSSIILGILQLFTSSLYIQGVFIRRVIGSAAISWWLFFLLVTWEAAPGIPSAGVMAALVISSALVTLGVRRDNAT